MLFDKGQMIERRNNLREEYDDLWHNLTPGGKRA
jgi:hypothetical protein